MTYSITTLSKLSGISSRTLRYYDEIGLLPPAYTDKTGCRYYENKQVNLLQQILFYKVRGFCLSDIHNILYQEDFDILQALENHLLSLQKQQNQLTQMIQTVQKTISDQKGEKTMQDTEKFMCFKEQVISAHEATYGTELRKQYGHAEINATHEKIRNMTMADYERFQNLKHEIQIQLEQAVLQNISPKSETAKRIVVLHKEWLGMTLQEYQTNIHKGITMLYTQDTRFTAYYDKNVSGCAAFLQNAILYWVDHI